MCSETSFRSYTEEQLDSLIFPPPEAEESEVSFQYDSVVSSTPFKTIGLVFPTRYHELSETDTLLQNELSEGPDISCSDNEHETSFRSYTEEQLDSLIFPPPEAEESEVSFQYDSVVSSTPFKTIGLVFPTRYHELSETDTLLQNELSGGPDISCSDNEHEISFRSYTEEQLDSLIFPPPDAEESEVSVRNVQSSTPFKNIQIESSFNEEDWRSFLYDKDNGKEDESFDISSSEENDSEMDNSYSVVEKNNVAAIDPDFYGEVYAAPRRLVPSKGM